MELLRLERVNPRAWRFYPEFERRVLAMQTEFRSRGLLPVLAEQLARRFVDFPEQALYYVALEGERVVAHMAGWIEQQWGVPYILVYQCQCDRGTTIRPIIEQYFTHEMGQAAERYNATLAPGKPRIEEIDLWTPWRPDVWKRLLHRDELTAELHVLRLPVGPPPVLLSEQLVETGGHTNGRRQ